MEKVGSRVFVYSRHTGIAKFREVFAYTREELSSLEEEAVFDMVDDLCASFWAVYPMVSYAFAEASADFYRRIQRFDGTVYH